MGQVAPRGVQDALRLGRGPAGVHDVERVLGVEGFGLVPLGLAFDQLVPPHVTVFVPGHRLAGAPDDEHLLHVGALGDGLVDGAFQTRWPRRAGTRRRP